MAGEKILPFAEGTHCNSQLWQPTARRILNFTSQQHFLVLRVAGTVDGDFSMNLDYLWSELSLQNKFGLSFIVTLVIVGLILAA